MLLIAHRGLTQGPDSKLENDPAQVQQALAQGYHAEIDLWWQNNKWMLGHDLPVYEVDSSFISQQRLWIHCKNLSAFFRMKTHHRDLNYFWHESDQVVLTNTGVVWTYFGLPETLSPYSICVMPEVNYTWEAIRAMHDQQLCMGICSDYVERIGKWQK